MPLSVEEDAKHRRIVKTKWAALWQSAFEADSWGQFIEAISEYEQYVSPRPNMIVLIPNELYQCTWFDTIDVPFYLCPPLFHVHLPSLSNAIGSTLSWIAKH